MESERNLQKALFLLRLSVFLVMFMWTIDKFLNPAHAAAVFAKFYLIAGLNNNLFYIIGGIQLVIIISFLIGFKKRISYGLVFVMHAISTLSAYQKYLNPFESPNLLFFAAIPMLAACFTLYSLRRQDTLLTVEN
ncbi:MAG: hypothetical protein AAF378_11955 [Cyanobacteria bacterium P01_A01_bin.84]